ncbi:branched-chain amino acid transaminase [Candidatus Bipolaricaulota bacterium]|nr:branched-chain amino acid transaminase [Candidatus Bipolaricaulota bacterium]
MPKNKYAFFRGEIRPIEEAKVSVMTSAFNYGTGVFEGIRAFWNEEEKELFVFRMPEHYARFLRSCKILLLDLPYSVEDLCQITLELLRREGFQEDVYIRPLAYKASEEIGVRLHNLESDLAIFALPFEAYLPPGGIRAMVSSWRRIEDNAIPARAKITGAYVNSALAKTEAYLAGFDEAIVLNEDGQVAEGSAENLFLVRDGVLITPPITANILEGITRDTVMTLARDLGLPVVERPVDRTELYLAEEVFLTGTAAGLAPVVEIDHRKIGTGKPGPIFNSLRDLYERVVRGKEKKYRSWCTPVYSRPAA